MPRPQVIVNITQSVARRGAPTETGTAFVLHSAGTGTTAPVEVLSATTVTDTYGTTAPVSTVAGYVAEIFAQGAPRVYVVKATGAAATLTEAEWTAALVKLSEEYGPGQVLIPGVSAAAAHTALLTHAATAPGRTALLDAAKDASAASLLTLATTYKTNSGAPRSALIAGWATVPAPAASIREVPGSVIAAGLAARGDAATGHANNAPIFDQGRGAGVVRNGQGVTVAFTDTEADSLHDGGITMLRMRYGTPTLVNWRSLSADVLYSQLNIGRLTAQVSTGLAASMERYLGRQIDGQGQLYAEIEGDLRGGLLGLYELSALYGATADDAFDVDVITANSKVDVAAGRVNANVVITPSRHTERIVISATVNVAGAAA